MMGHILSNKSFRIGLAALVIIMGMMNLETQRGALAAPGDEAPDSTIILQMPFIAGETWIVGGGGSFYGDGYHTNAYNDYYATDWNLSSGSDLGKAVLPVADGTVSAIVAPPCPTTNPSFGCYVRIDHADGYRTQYAHLSQVLVTNGATVHTWTLIGKVGNSGTNDPHLHLRFQRNNGGYYSRCNTAIPPSTTCPNGEAPLSPQGHKPSPMMTTLGPTTLQDGYSYTSVNGRVYLPDLQNQNGFLTTFYVRNNGTEQRNAKIYFFNTNGTPTAHPTDTCILNPNQWCPIIVSDWGRISTQGTAYIDGAENLAVTVRRERAVSGFYELDAYNALLASSADWEFAGAYLYAPIVKDNHYNRSSRLLVLNPGTASTTAGASLFPFSGGLPSSASTNVASNGQGEILSTNCAVTWCSVYITDNNSPSKPLGIIIREESLANPSATSPSVYSAFSVGATKNFVPVVKKGYAGLTTGVVVQNLGSGTPTVTFTCYPLDGSPAINCETRTIAPYASAVFYLGNIPAVPTGFLGSGVLTTSPSEIIASIFQESNANATLGTNAPMNGSLTAYAPEVYGNYLQDGQTWDSGISVQNTGGSAASVTVTYYDPAGNVIPGWTQIVTINPNRSQIFSRWRGNLPNTNFIGSAVIQSNQPIVATVNTSHSGSGDPTASYTALNR